MNMVYKNSFREAQFKSVAILTTMNGTSIAKRYLRDLIDDFESLDNKQIQAWIKNHKEIFSRIHV